MMEAAAAAAPPARRPAARVAGAVAAACAVAAIALLRRGAAAGAIHTTQPAATPPQVLGPSTNATPATRDLFWLHIPKCGSGFVNVACRLCCPALPPGAKFGCVADYGPDRRGDHLGPQQGQCRWSGLGDVRQSSCDVAWLNGFMDAKRAECNGGGRHLPYNATLHRGRAVGLFRSPAARVVSGYRDRLHCWPTAGCTARPALLKAVARETQEARRVAAYASFCARGACVRNCATKMVLGLECYAYAPALSPAQVAAAVGELEAGFLMVGLTEHWDLSAALAHAAVRGDAAVAPAELLKVRSSGDPAAQFAALESTGAWDARRSEAADEVLYAHAAFLFWTRAAAAGLVDATRARRLAARAVDDLEARGRRAR